MDSNQNQASNALKAVYASRIWLLFDEGAKEEWVMYTSRGKTKFIAMLAMK